MSNRVVLPYLSNESKTQGDSAIPVECAVPYYEGMDVDDLHEKVVRAIGKDWGYDIENMSNNDLAEELFGHDVEGNVPKIVGGFVIEESLYKKVLNSGRDVGNDSALYAMIHSMKNMIAELSEMEIK